VNEHAPGPISIDAGACRLLVDTELPAMFDEYVRRADFVDTIGISLADAGRFFVASDTAGTEWPQVVIALGHRPCGAGFAPGVVFVPETSALFIGAGTTLLAYALDGAPRRLWEDETEVGFWRWRRVGGVVLMSAELELAAWDVLGRKLWSTVVEPPWSYEVRNALVRLDVMGSVREFPIESGPEL
jgi:hypothetical protein